jgi:hypothetical protein
VTDRNENIEASSGQPRNTRGRRRRISVPNQPKCINGFGSRSTRDGYSAFAIERVSSSSSEASRLPRRFEAGERKRPLSGPPRTCRVQRTPAQASMTMFSVAITPARNPTQQEFHGRFTVAPILQFFYGSPCGAEPGGGGSEGVRPLSRNRSRRSLRASGPDGSEARHLRWEATNSKMSGGVVR